MSIIVLNNIKNEDVYNNFNCYFIYGENEKKEGGDTFRRQQKNCLPLTIRKTASQDISGYWDDSSYSYNVDRFTEDAKVVISVLNAGGIVVIDNDFLNEENNSPMKTHGQRTLMFLNASVNSLIAENKPKYVSVERL